MIRVKGNDKPVRFTDHVKGFQSQMTRATQRAAQIQRELEQAKQERAEYQRQVEQAQHGQGNGQPSIVDQLNELPYLSGRDAAQVIQNISTQFAQRDQILLAALQRMKQMQEVVNNLNTNHVNTGFDSKINRWLEEGGYPKEAADLMKEVYLAYEGDDLDEEFPGIFRDRWNGIQKALEGARQAKVNAARKTPFVPGRGGHANPSKPLQFKGGESARQMADELWDQMKGTDT